MPLAARCAVARIGLHRPRAGERYLLDTNVLFALTYSPATLDPAGVSATRFQPYTEWVSLAIQEGATLISVAVQFLELAHVIETAELNQYKLTSGFRNVTLKEFRHDCARERRSVVDQIANAWQAVTALTSCLPSVSIDAAFVDNCIARLQGSKELVDAYDLTILRTIESNGVLNVVTDDSDFVTSSGLLVITANEKAIQAAKKAGRLRRD